MRTWVIEVDGFPPAERDAETRGKAHAWAFRLLNRELGYGIAWKEIKVRVKKETQNEDSKRSV